MTYYKVSHPIDQKSGTPKSSSEYFYLFLYFLKIWTADVSTKWLNLEENKNRTRDKVFVQNKFFASRRKVKIEDFNKIKTKSALDNSNFLEQMFYQQWHLNVQTQSHSSATENLSSITIKLKDYKPTSNVLSSQLWQYTIKWANEKNSTSNFFFSIVIWNFLTN